jgi:hypothetical protein
MKLFRVILFSFSLGSTGAYFYDYSRTNGNVSKSAQFAIYCLGFQLGFCSLFINQYQQTQIVSIAKVLIVNSYIFIFD